MAALRQLSVLLSDGYAGGVADYQRSRCGVDTYTKRRYFVLFLRRARSVAAIIYGEDGPKSPFRRGRRRRTMRGRFMWWRLPFRRNRGNRVLRGRARRPNWPRHLMRL